MGVHDGGWDYRWAAGGVGGVVGQSEHGRAF